MIDIFISRPTYIPDRFKEGLNNFHNVIDTLELNPRTLGVSEYPTDTPLDEVINILKTCKGAIILGYPQIEILSGSIRDNKIEKPAFLGTEWNHIEASLACAINIPLLIIHHNNVIRGIFDKGAINKYLYEIDLSLSNWVLSENIIGAIKKWKSQIIDHKNNHDSKNISLNLDKPFCPNCSTSTFKSYLSPIPKDFVEIEDANYECSKCHFKMRV